jgi:hypothetical protein
MPHPDIVRRALRTALASGLMAVIALLGCAAIAQAAGGFGELARFGKMGIGPGELAGNEPAEPLSTLGLGVDSTDNSVYVIDEPKEDETAGKEFTRHIRLQKFKSVAGKYEVAASAEVSETSPIGSKFTVEGVAVDSKRKRVYLLATDARKKNAPIEPGRPAASTLYAFSTEESGAALVPEGKTGAILTGPGAGELEAQSSTPGKALLEPRGITVDPKSGDVIILAEEDAEVGGKLQQRFVLQRVNGSGALGARYVDTTGFLKKGFFEGTKPDSPVVVGPESSPRVYVNFEGLAQIPYEFSSSEQPKQVFEEPHELVKELAPLEKGVEREHGGVLSVSPDGGTIYGETEIFSEKDLAAYPGVFARSATTGALIGWTGGQSPRLSHEDECVLTPLATITKPVTPVAGGSEGKIFVLATPYLLEVEVEEEEEPLVPHPAVIEFGPGEAAKGCPTATTEALQAKANSTALTQGAQIPQETTVTFLAHPFGADALSVKWQVENTATHEKTGEVKATNEKTGEYRVPKFAFKFSKPGGYTVTAVMETDDFATPLLEKTPESKPISFVLSVKETPEEEAARKKKEKEKEVKEQEAKEKEAKERAEKEKPAKEKAEKEKAEKEKTEQQQREREARERAQREAAEAQERATTEAAERAARERAAAAGAQEHGVPSGGVLSYQASLAATRISVAKSGAFSIVVNCAGASSCTGTATLRTLNAVSAGHSKHKAVLTLASASFAVAGAHKQTVKMHLSAPSRALLASAHTLKARVTILARDSAGKTHTTQVVVTLQAARAGH